MINSLLPDSPKLEKVFGIRNRWLCFAVYMSAIFLTSCIYYGWQHMQWILVMSGKFEDACSDDAFRPEGSETYDYLCDEQADAIDIAYTVASSCEFAGGLVAGLLYDYTGPVFSVVIGELLHFCAWMVILFSYSSGFLYLGFAMIGLAVNIIAIPAMILMNRFPRYPMLMESFNLSAQTMTAFTMPTIFILLRDNPTWTWISVMSVYLPFAACVAIAYIFLLPYKQSQIPTIAAVIERKPHYNTLWWFLARPQYIVFIIWYTLMIMTMSMLNVKLDTVASHDVSAFIGWIFWLQAPLGVMFGLLNEKIRSLYIAFVLNIMMIAAYALCIANTIYRNNFFDGDVPDEIDDSMDWGVPQEVMFYIGATLYVVANSYIYTVKYTWVTEVFPGKHFGTMVGCVGLSAGVIQTINTVFVKYEALTMLSVYCALSLICFVLLLYIWVSTVHKSVDYKEPLYWEDSSVHSSKSLEDGEKGDTQRSGKQIDSYSYSSDEEVVVEV